MLHPNASAYGNWLLNTLTSPLLELGGRRAVPPQGAHSRKPNIPDLLNTFGQELKYYDPLLAEHIFGKLTLMICALSHVKRQIIGL